MSRQSTGVPSLRESLALARALGCEVKILNRTGEVVVSTPKRGPRCRVNCRRKDSTPELTKLLRTLEGARGN